MGIAVGIQLGLNSARVAAMRDGRPFVILNDFGGTATPCAIWEDPSGKLAFGAVAYKKVGAALQFQRHMGSDLKLELGTRQMSPEQCSSLIVRKLVEDAERTLREKVEAAVITVPVNWKDGPRRATVVAGRLAGVKVERLINEPTAAAMAYGMREDADGKTIAVYDLGGGTFDITLLRIQQKVFEIITNNGDDRLGGMDFDQQILDVLMGGLTDRTGYRLPPKEARDPKMKQRVRDLELACEAAKKELSFKQEAVVSVPFLDFHNGEPLGIEEQLTRAGLEHLLAPAVERTIQYMEKSLREAKLKKQDIDEIVLVGGSTRIPFVRQRVAEFFGKDPVGASVNPEDAIVLGAAIQAEAIIREDTAACPFVSLDFVANTLGLETSSEIGGRRIEGVFSSIIPKGTKVPAQSSVRLVTTVDNQHRIEVRLFEGESPLTAHNTFLGPLVVEDLPPRPAGDVAVEFTFNKDVSDLLAVTWRMFERQWQPINEGATALPCRSGVFDHPQESFAEHTIKEEDWLHCPLALQYESLIRQAQVLLEKSPGYVRASRVGTLLMNLLQAIRDGDEGTAEYLDLILTEILYRFDLEEA